MDSILIDGNTYVTPKGGDIFNSPLKRDSEANADLHPEWILSHNSKTKEKMKCLDSLIGSGKHSNSIKHGFLQMIIVKN
jgi:hypothetical protein